MQLISEASLQIQKPIQEVFNAIILPEHMTQYFIAESSGVLETEAEILWKFPEFNERFPITHIQVVQNKSVSFVWDPETVVRIELESYQSESTIVHITEGAKALSEENLKWHTLNTAGWMNCLACMKAYLEYGVRLRKGAYDFMKN